MEYARLSTNKLKMLLNVKMDGIAIEHKNEQSQLTSEFITKGMIKSGIYLKALLSLFIKQTRHHTELFFESLIEAIEPGKPINEDLKNTLIKRISNFIQQQINMKKSDISCIIIANQLDSVLIQSTIFNRIENEQIRIVNYFSDKLLLKLEEYPSLDQILEKQKSITIIDQDYVDQNRIREIRSINCKDYDLSKLIQLCIELNISYKNGCLYSIPLLMRTVIDHIPPIFEKKYFNEVANNYGTKSFKKSMLHLENSLRNIADSYLHTHIRGSESQPNIIQIDFKNDLDFLLGEIYRVLKIANHRIEPTT